ncbi:MAG: hypothetical protein V7636_537, partial [Actinomycetota bacterium]
CVRADRLLRILLLLQTRGRATAADLAAALEVSVRTVQRDMDALSGAGVPVYAERGSGGGWRLVDGFRTSLTGLTPDEALAVAVGRPDRVLRDLGLHGSGEQAMLKVLAAVPALAHEAAQHAAQRVHVDLEPWARDTSEDRGTLRALYQAAATDTVVRLRYGTNRQTVDAEPLGLVVKGMVWYLVAGTRRGMRTYRVARIRDVELTDEHLVRPESFDLAQHWRAVCDELVTTFAEYIVTLRVTIQGLQRLRWSSGHPLHLVDPDGDGWTVVRVNLESPEDALHVVLGLGAAARVVRPAALGRAVADEATKIAAAS